MSFIQRVYKSNWFLIAVILVVALIVRAYTITSRTLYGDELTMVLDTYSILKTSKDQLGNILPLTFKMGAGRPGGYIYFSLPFVALFGPSDLGIRSLALMSSVLSVFLVYLIAKKLLNRQVALIAALLTAFSPWSLSLSRGGFEAGFALLLALLGTYLFLNSKTKLFSFVLSAIVFGLSVLTYPTYKLVLAFFIPILFYLKLKNEKITKYSKKGLYIFFMVLLMFASVSLYELFTNNSEERFLSINFIARQDIRGKIVENINYNRLNSSLPKDLQSLFYNKLLSYPIFFVDNYFKNFSTDYLFLSGDKNPRHNPSEYGAFMYVEMLSIFLGFIFLLKKNRNVLILILCWIFLVPVATALLADPHNLRNAFMFPPLTMFSAYGIYSIYKSKKIVNRYLVSVLITAYVIQIVFVLVNIYSLSLYKHQKLWAFSAAQAVNLARDNYGNYDHIVISAGIDNVEYAYPVYSKTDPKEVIYQNNHKTNIGGYDFKVFGNIYIGRIAKHEIESIMNMFDGNNLFVGDYGNDSEYLDNYKIMYYRDQSPSIIYKEY